MTDVSARESCDLLAQTALFVTPEREVGFEIEVGPVRVVLRMTPEEARFLADNLHAQAAFIEAG